MVLIMLALKITRQIETERNEVRTSLVYLIIKMYMCKMSNML